MKLLHWLVVALVSIALFGCGKKEIVGTGPITNETRNMTSFSAIKVNGTFDVHIDIGQPQSVVVASNANLLPYIITTVKKDTLIIEPEHNRSLKPQGKQVINIKVPTLQSAAFAGANSLDLQGIKNKEFTLELNGTNSGRLTGATQLFNLQISGQAKLNAEQLAAEYVTLNANGNSDMTVNAVNKLEIKLYGNNIVKYVGNARVDQQIFGVGTITKLR